MHHARAGFSLLRLVALYYSAVAQNDFEHVNRVFCNVKRLVRARARAHLVVARVAHANVCALKV